MQMTYRIAVIGDIHGNLHAFEAVLAHVRAQGPDVIVLLGDYVVGYPDSLACWQLAQSLGCPMLRGNHERSLMHFGTTAAAPETRSEQYAPVSWTHARFPAHELAALAALPMTLSLSGLPDVLFMHAAPEHDRLAVFPHTADEIVEAHFGARPEHVHVRGHNHLATERQWRDKRIITIGSVGLPLDGYPQARYMLLDGESDDWQTTHLAVEYDRAAALLRFHESGWLRDAGVVGRLYYDEARFCTHMISPQFFALVRQGLTLEQAYARFLGG